MSPGLVRPTAAWRSLALAGAVALAPPAAAQQASPAAPEAPPAPAFGGVQRRATDGESVLLLRPALGAALTQPDPLAPRSLAGPSLAEPADAPAPLPCPECTPPRRFWFGALELMAVQAIPLSINAIGRDAEWAKISLKSWGDNLAFPWQWDNNKFINNQFSHPYHGSLYFNSGRVNGYDFWQSTPWALGGSLMWELFGEVWAPSPNDLANTTLGGITLGETIYRLSGAILKNEATGMERIGREVAAGLLNPVRGFSRLVHGDVSRVSQTPPDWRPSRFHFLLDAGGRAFSTTEDITDSTALDQGYLQLQLQYGDPYADVVKSPFSTFVMSAVISSNSTTKAKTFAELRARGSLLGRELGGKGSNVVFVANMTYDFFSNPAFELGGQGFTAGIRATTDRQRAWSLAGQARARFNPIAATRSDYFLTTEGRDYDYGIGAGGELQGTLTWARRGFLDVNGSYLWIPVLSGFPGDHHNTFLTATARGYLWRSVGLGAYYGRYWRRSNYDFQPDVQRNSSEGRVFLTFITPRMP